MVFKLTETLLWWNSKRCCCLEEYLWMRLALADVIASEDLLHRLE
jgi:hypothetical protein